MLARRLALLALRGPSRVLVGLLGGALLLAAPVAALERPTFFWTARIGDGCSAGRARVESLLGEVLEKAPDARHIVGVKGIGKELVERGFPLPSCLGGLSTCDSPAEAVVDAMAASTLIDFTLRDGCKKAEVTVADPAGETAPPQTFEGKDLRDLLFTMANELTGSKGELTITSTPSGATVSVNGTAMGETPAHLLLDLGAYQLRVSADGYFPFDTSAELRAGDRLSLDAALARSYAAITVFSETPGAYLTIDDDPTPHPVNEPVRFEPGARKMTVEAPGFNPLVTNLNLVAGEERDLRVVLFESEATLDARMRSQLMASPLLLQARAGYLVSSSDWLGSESADGRQLDCPIRNDETGCSEGGASHGFELAFEPIFTWRHWEALPLGGSVAFAGAPADVDAFRLKNETLEGVNPTETSSWRLRFLQGGYRRLLNRYWEPHLLGGFAFGRNAIRVASISDTKNVEFVNQAFAFEVRGGTRFHLNSLVYATGDLMLASNLSQGGQPWFGLTVGVGINLPDRTGLTSWLNGLMPSSATEDKEATSPPLDL